RHRRIGTDRPLRDRLLGADVHAGPDLLRDRREDVHHQEREQRPGGRDGDVRRPRRHPDDGAAHGRAAADGLHEVSPIARVGALVAAVAFAAAAAAPPAPADGDPASDVLLFQNVYLPAQAPSRAVSEVLENIASAVYRRGDRVKVAIVYDQSDLGRIPPLYGVAKGSARSLGLELGLGYAGPLLVVMPAGLGVYDGGRSTSAAEAALQSVRVTAATPDDLTRSATAALEALEAAGTLRSPDVKAPLVTPRPASATPRGGATP